MNEMGGEQQDPVYRILHVLSKISTALRAHEWRCAGPEGLTPTQAQILILLWRRGAGLNMTRLSEELGVTPATASDTAKTLERKGLLSKARDRNGDRRVVGMALTAEGEAVAARASAWPEPLVEAMKGLAPDEEQVLIRTLMTMMHRLERQGYVSQQRMCGNCNHFKPHIHTANVHAGDGAEVLAHHCHAFGQAMGDRDLQVDCPYFESASRLEVQRLWARYLAGEPAE